MDDVWEKPSLHFSPGAHLPVSKRDAYPTPGNFPGLARCSKAPVRYKKNVKKNLILKKSTQSLLKTSQRYS